MKETGWFMLIGGLALLAYGFVMDTTTGGYLDSDRVHNLGLLSNRVYIGILGGFVFLAGIVALAAATIVEALQAAGVAAPAARFAGPVAVAPTSAAMPPVEANENCASCGRPLAAADAKWLKNRPYCGPCFSAALL